MPTQPKTTRHGCAAHARVQRASAPGREPFVGRAPFAGGGLSVEGRLVLVLFLPVLGHDVRPFVGSSFH